VKNFAQAMELSQNVTDEQALKRELRTMGVDVLAAPASEPSTPADD
jgi:DNA-directed RNA polymerase subunit B"